MDTQGYIRASHLVGVQLLFLHTIFTQLSSITRGKAFEAFLPAFHETAKRMAQGTLSVQDAQAFTKSVGELLEAYGSEIPSLSME